MKVRKTKGHSVVHDARVFPSGKNKKKQWQCAVDIVSKMGCDDKASKQLTKNNGVHWRLPHISAIYCALEATTGATRVRLRMTSPLLPLPWSVCRCATSSTISTDIRHFALFFFPDFALHPLHCKRRNVRQKQGDNPAFAPRWCCMLLCYCSNSIVFNNPHIRVLGPPFPPCGCIPSLLSTMQHIGYASLFADAQPPSSLPLFVSTESPFRLHCTVLCPVLCLFSVDRLDRPFSSVSAFLFLPSPFCAFVRFYFSTPHSSHPEGHRWST